MPQSKTLAAPRIARTAFLHEADASYLHEPDADVKIENDGKDAFIVVKSKSHAPSYIPAQRFNSDSRLHIERQPGSISLMQNFGDVLYVLNTKSDMHPAKIGAHMQDGTVYAGISPTTNQPLFTLPQDADRSRVYASWPAPNEYIGDFCKADRWILNQSVNGRNDWELPCRRELALLFTNRAAIGNFQTNPADDREATSYFSCEHQSERRVWTQSFDTGYQGTVISDYGVVVHNRFQARYIRSLNRIAAHTRCIEHLRSGWRPHYLS